jgi:hypothetical protein
VVSLFGCCDHRRLWHRTRVSMHPEVRLREEHDDA